MGPDLDELLLKLKDANENLSKAFIQQSLAWNAVNNALREMRETPLTLFNQKDN